MNIPAEIKNKRNSLMESQKAFGKRFKVSHASVSDWEAGKSEAPYKVINFCHSCTDDHIKWFEMGKRQSEKYEKIGKAIEDMIREMTTKEDY